MGSVGRNPIEHHSGLERHGAGGEPLAGLAALDAASPKFRPTLAPIIDGWFSSNFGYRIDPFTGMQSFHDGIEFRADNGTPVVAAASGKVVESGYQPQYGKIIVIDHGNGLVSRYAHASELYVNEGGLVVRGQRVAAVGATGRATAVRTCISRFG
jgi:murein DD-endopeptidase MepM/ murein hydrolase activator NlpD